MAIDYAALAAKHGGTVTPQTPLPKPPMPTAGVDYTGLAAKYGGTSTPVNNGTLFANVQAQNRQANPPPPNWWERSTSAASDLGNTILGAAKGVVDLPREAASLGASVGETLANTSVGKYLGQGIRNTLGKVVSPETAKQLQQGVNQGVEQTALTRPEGDAQKLGYGAEKVAEFFVPGLGAESAAGKLASLGTKAAELAPTAEKVATIASKVPEAASIGEKIIQAGKGALKVGKESIMSAFDQGARTALQEGKVDDNATTAAGIAAAVPVLGAGLGLVKSQLPKWSQSLQEMTLRLTPVQKRQFATKIDDVVNFLQENKVVGTAKQRLNQVTSKYEEMEPKLQKFLTEDAKDVSIPKEQLLSKLDDLKAAYQDRVDSDLIESQIDRIKRTIAKNQGDTIAASKVNKLKRSAYDSAYNESGNKVLDDVMHGVGDTLRTSLEDVTKGMTIDGKSIGEFNKKYGTLINARTLLSTAATRKDVGFLSKLVSSGVGGLAGSVGGPLGSAIGASVAPGVTELAAGTLPKSLLAAGLQGLSEKSIPQSAKNITKRLGQGLTSQAIQQNKE